MDAEKQNDYKWQLSNMITNGRELSKYINLNEDEIEQIDRTASQYRMMISPYYASMMSKDDKNCPFRQQAIASEQELLFETGNNADPLCEEANSPTKCIVHRYPDRVLFLVTNKCFTYCRHCTRKRILVGGEFCSNSNIEEGLDYISKHSEIRDVVVSGGDPLTLNDSSLEYIISQLRKIEHVEIIRIGTRTPVVMPMRITDELVNMLKKYKPIWVNTHFNHPKEITPQSCKALSLFIDNGIPVGNQSVLLKNINDDVEVMKKLIHLLVFNRVRPYYLYQCDISQGIGHFRTSVQTGINIIEELIGHTTGFAIPQYVIDLPNGGGKVPISPNYVITNDKDSIMLRNYEKKVYEYHKLDF